MLVSVFLPGGADSLSVLYPAGDAAYRKLRPQLAFPEAAGPVFSEDDRLHWHPSLSGSRVSHFATGFQYENRASRRLRPTSITMTAAISTSSPASTPVALNIDSA